MSSTTTEKDYLRLPLTKESFKKSFERNLQYMLGKNIDTATDIEKYKALAISIKDRLIERWISTLKKYQENNVKKVYYLSMEFLIGRLLGNNVLNLGVENEIEDAIAELGLDFSHLRGVEIDAGLGNGGLGRLAACFIDSMATLGIPGFGYSLRYEYGIFHQKIVNGYQFERPDEWLRTGNPWEIAKPEESVTVKFGGKTMTIKNEKGHLRSIWIDTDDVLAVPYDIPVPGYKNEVVNTLRLWSATSTEEFDLDYFNSGDYLAAVEKKLISENITKVLYPNDNNQEGRELRLRQEYMLTSASIQDIVRNFKISNNNFSHFPDKVAIQLNDTHPAIAIPELMRILLDNEGLSWDQAWYIVCNTFAYTNHTLLPEALEKWRVSIFEKLLPRHLEIIFEINAHFLRVVANKFPGDNDRLSRMSIIQESPEKMIRMSHLCIVGSHKINGVSELHSNLVKNYMFHDFYKLFPNRFTNKTNGITPRRWLLKSNPRLSKLITEAIGDKWIKDLSHLKNLEKFTTDASFKEQWYSIKQANKSYLQSYIYESTGKHLNTESIFDVQVKRIHEYKRQTLFAFYLIHEYLRIKEGKDIVPKTAIIAGKAAPGYFMAKLIIKLFTTISDVINNDIEIKDRLKVMFLENYRVSLAEKIFPASNLSQQISMAGTEASGTGNMKFMLNGALTLGTLDGANIEIKEECGDDNIFIFGLKADEILAIKEKHYHPQTYINQSESLSKVLNLIQSDFFSHNEPGIFKPLVDSIRHQDNYLVCADFDSYVQAQDKVSQEYLNRDAWTIKSILNVASSGKFSSDRTIMDYAQEIWHVPISL